MEKKGQKVMKIDLEGLSEKFEILVQQLHEVRNTNGEVDGRGISLAITHVETAHLWFEDAIKAEEDPAS